MSTQRLAGGHGIDVAGTEVVLLPERAIWIPSLSALVVADLHWGKAAAFRAAHVPVPMGTTSSDLARLSSALDATKAHSLIVLGDLLHAKAGRHDETFRTIAEWRSKHASVSITLVRGNHDAHAGDPPAELGVSCVNAPLRFGPFVGVHEPEPWPDGYVLSGHLHPCISMYGRGKQSARLPAFVFGPKVGVLPAFSSFTGTGMYERDPQDRLYAIAGDEVIPMTESRPAL